MALDKRRELNALQLAILVIVHRLFASKVRQPPLRCPAAGPLHQPLAVQALDELRSKRGHRRIAWDVLEVWEVGWQAGVIDDWDAHALRTATDILTEDGGAVALLRRQPL